MFDGILPNSTRKFETNVEKKLREIGEWLAAESERSSRSSSGTEFLLVYSLLLQSLWCILMIISANWYAIIQDKVSNSVELYGI